jgi:hypothetical protein
MSVGVKVENTVPGGVYLCQVGEQVSCGACCGLYNVEDPSARALEALLRHRTELFHDVPRQMEAILAFKEKIESGESQTRPYAEFHHCPYIGLIGNRGLRVGCLLHPLAPGNDGVDWRGISFYGGMACRVYFCPSYRHLSPVMKRVLREIVPGWYLYGLVVTETEMLEGFLFALQGRLGRPLSVEDVVGDDDCRETLLEFLSLKVDWPYRDRASPVSGNYFFHDALYGPPPIDYEGLSVLPSRYDAILRALQSRFGSAADLEESENLLDDIIDRLASHITSRSLNGCRVLRR